MYGLDIVFVEESGNFVGDGREKRDVCPFWARFGSYDLSDIGLFKGPFDVSTGVLILTEGVLQVL